MFNSIEEEINVINAIVEEAVIHGGDAGGAYFSNTSGIEDVLNLWVQRKELFDEYKVIIEEREFKHTKDIFNCYPKIVPIDYDIYHEDWDIEEKVVSDWGF